MKKTQTTKDGKGRESIMVRTDLTIQDLMGAKPWSRWDINYWHPKFESIHKEMGDKFFVLGDQLSEDKIAFPDSVRESRGESLGNQYSTHYFRVSEFLNTGYDWPNIKKCSDNAAKRLGRTKLSENNVLIARSGATLGSTLIISDPPIKSCTGDLFVLDFKGSKINPYFFTVFMKTKYGRLQFGRFLYGTASPKISVEHIRSLKIPIVSKDVQKNIESEYKKMSAYHDKAMGIKKKDDAVEYKKNIDTASKMLEDLIVKTEVVIRGERKDVN